MNNLVSSIALKVAGMFKTPMYDSYESALAACKNGYQDSDLVDVMYEKTKSYRDSILLNRLSVLPMTSFRILIGLMLSIPDRSRVNVIDFGGASGIHYFTAKRILGERIDLRWHVVETPAMVSRAMDLEDGDLKFFHDLAQAKDALGHVDLMLSSGAIQYVPRPYDIVEQMVGCEADNLFITRFGLSTLPNEVVSVQRSYLRNNGYGPLPQGFNDKPIKYPVTFVRKDKFEEILNKAYSIQAIFEEDRASYRAGNQSIDMYGYWAVRKDM